MIDRSKIPIFRAIVNRPVCLSTFQVHVAAEIGLSCDCHEHVPRMEALLGSY
jgi:hypothetical protein